MTFEDKITVIQTAFQDLGKALNELCRDLWCEVDSTDLAAVGFAASFQQRLVSSIKDFERSTGAILVLLNNRQGHAAFGGAPSTLEVSPGQSKDGGWPSKAKRGSPMRKVAPARRLSVSRPKSPTAMKEALESLSSLERTAGEGAAPNKAAAMLMAVARKIERGEILTREVEFSVDLADEFQSILSETGARASLEDACQAYLNLRLTSFWKLRPLPGRESDLRETTEVGSLNDLNRVVLNTKLDRNLFDCLRYPEYSRQLQKLIGERFMKSSAK